MAYDFLAAWPGLSAADHQQIRVKLAAEAEYYYAAMTVIKGGQNEGNQRTLGASALGICALALSEYRGSEHTPQQWLDMALAAIRGPGNFSFFRPDGMFIEGYGYTTYMGLILVPFMAAYTRLDGTGPLRRAHARRLAALPRLFVPAGQPQRQLRDE